METLVDEWVAGLVVVAADCADAPVPLPGTDGLLVVPDGVPAVAGLRLGGPAGGSLDDWPGELDAAAGGVAEQDDEAVLSAGVLVPVGALLSPEEPDPAPCGPDGAALGEVFPPAEADGADPLDEHDAPASGAVDEPSTVCDPCPVDEPCTVCEPWTVDEPCTVCDPCPVDEPCTVCDPCAVDDPCPVDEPWTVDEPRTVCVPGAVSFDSLPPDVEVEFGGLGAELSPCPAPDGDGALADAVVPLGFDGEAVGSGVVGEVARTVADPPDWPVADAVDRTVADAVDRTVADAVDRTVADAADADAPDACITSFIDALEAAADAAGQRADALASDRHDTVPACAAGEATPTSRAASVNAKPHAV